MLGSRIPDGVQYGTGYGKVPQKSNVLDMNTIQMMMTDQKNKWRDCQRKQCTCYAIVPSEGWVIADNSLQSRSANYIHSVAKKGIMRVEKLTAKDKEFLKTTGCSITDGKSVVVCEPLGNLTMMSPSEFALKYTTMENGRITELPKKWTSVLQRADGRPSGKGMQIHPQYNTTFNQGNTVVHLNDYNGANGDIIIVEGNGRIIAVNNKVFSTTYNLHIGGWGQSGLVKNVSNNDFVTLDKVKHMYPFESVEDINYWFNRCREISCAGNSRIKVEQWDKRTNGPNLSSFSEDTNMYTRGKKGFIVEGKDTKNGYLVLDDGNYMKYVRVDMKAPQVQSVSHRQLKPLSQEFLQLVLKLR